MLSVEAKNMSTANNNPYVAVSRGLGRHVWATPVDSLYALALGLFIAEIGYFFTLMLCKWSILAFYWRTFYIRESIKLPICILAVVVLFWGMAVVSCYLLTQTTLPNSN